ASTPATAPSSTPRRSRLPAWPRRYAPGGGPEGAANPGGPGGGGGGPGGPRGGGGGGGAPGGGGPGGGYCALTSDPRPARRAAPAPAPVPSPGSGPWGGPGVRHRS